MKLRIIQAFDATIQPWYRLQKLTPTAGWTYVNSSSYLQELETQANNMIEHGELFVVVKEFAPKPQPLVDSTPECEHSTPNGNPTAAV